MVAVGRRVTVLAAGGLFALGVAVGPVGHTFAAFSDQRDVRATVAAGTWPTKSTCTAFLERWRPDTDSSPTDPLSSWSSGLTTDYWGSVPLHTGGTGGSSRGMTPTVLVDGHSQTGSNGSAPVTATSDQAHHNGQLLTDDPPAELADGHLHTVTIKVESDDEKSCDGNDEVTFYLKASR